MEEKNIRGTKGCEKSVGGRRQREVQSDEQQPNKRNLSEDASLLTGLIPDPSCSRLFHAAKYPPGQTGFLNKMTGRRQGSTKYDRLAIVNVCTMFYDTPESTCDLYTTKIITLGGLSAGLPQEGNKP